MLGPHTVTFVRPAGRDGWGDVEAGETTTDVPGCFWQPVSAAEQQGTGADTVTVTARLFAPAAVDVVATDRVRYGGREYTIEGRPELHSTPVGAHHYEISLRDVEG